MVEGPILTVSMEEDQIEDMMPLLERLVDAAKAGTPGMMLAQIFSCDMRVFFVSHEQSMEIQRILGLPIGRTTVDSAAVGAF